MDNKEHFLSFIVNKNRSVLKTKNRESAFLFIDMIPKEFKGKKYYASRTSFTTNRTVVQNILEKEIEEHDEEVDYGTDITEFI